MPTFRFIVKIGAGLETTEIRRQAKSMDDAKKKDIPGVIAIQKEPPRNARKGGKK